MAELAKLYLAYTCYRELFFIIEGGIQFQFTQSSCLWGSSSQISGKNQKLPGCSLVFAHVRLNPFYNIPVGWVGRASLRNMWSDYFNPGWVGQAPLGIYLLLWIICYPTLRVAPNSPNVLIFEDLLYRFLVKIPRCSPTFACVSHNYFTASCVCLWDLIHACVRPNHFTTSGVYPCETWSISQHPMFARVRLNYFTAPHVSLCEI
jgi:hypothetical protein